MQGFPTLTQERNKTLGFPSLADNVWIVHGWAEQIRVARDLAQSKCQEKPVHRSRLLGVQGIYVIPRPNVHKFPHSPEGKTEKIWTALLGRIGRLAQVSSKKRHSAALISRESQNPSGSPSKWRLTITNLKLLRTIFIGCIPSTPEAMQVVGDRPELHSSGEHQEIFSCD